MKEKIKEGESLEKKNVESESSTILGTAGESIRGNNRKAGGNSTGSSKGSGTDNSRTSESGTGLITHESGHDTGKTGNADNGSNSESGRSNRTNSGTDRSGNETGGVDNKEFYQRPIELKPKDVKPKKAAAKSKEKKAVSDDITDVETISILLQTGFAMVAGITKREHWAITEDEAETIAAPASTMLKKLTTAQRKKISAMTAPLMLASAVTAVVLPRVAIELTMNRRKPVNGTATGTNVTREIKPSQPGSIEQTITGSSNAASTNVSASDTPKNNPVITGLFAQVDNGAAGI